MKKGFTLIELLAVIVILAIIALIATPIVLNIINDAKESAVLRSADFYVDALENEIMLENMKQGGSFNPNTCTITNGTVSCDGKEITLKADGEMPSSGSITFEEGKVKDVNLTYTNGNVTLNKKGELVLGESKEEPICKLISDVAPTGISAGDKYQCKVKDDMEEGFEDGYYFYVLGTNSDGTTNLIMERNIYYDSTNDVGMVATSTNKGLVAWQTSGTNADGPVTAMDYIYKATKDWDNIPNMIMNYEDENIDYSTQQKGTTGYGTIITTNNITKIINKDGSAVTVLTDKEGYTNLKARMPMYNEVHGEGKCLTYDENGNKDGSCPLYLVNYLANSSYVIGEGLQNISEIYGYWTLSSRPHISNYVWDVYFVGSVDNDIVDDDSYSGVRPVITLEI